MILHESTGRNRRTWLKATGHGSVFLGLALIGLIWASLGLHLRSERDAAERAAVQNVDNLIRAFGSHLSASLDEIDRMLKIVRQSYVVNPNDFYFKNEAIRNLIPDGVVFRLGIVGPDGLLKWSSTGATPTDQIYLGDSESFLFHVNAKDDELFIGKPVIGRYGGRPAIQLSRKISEDGSFNGAVIAVMDPNYFTKLFDSVNIGPNGHINIVGTDGIIRAMRGDETDRIGWSLSGSPLLSHYATQSAGWYYNRSTLIDRIPRLIAYRATDPFPLIITIGVSTATIFGDVDSKQGMYGVVASLLTLLISIVVVLSVMGRVKLDHMAERLLQQNLRFDLAIRNMSQGLSMFDKSERLVFCNQRYGDMYRLPTDLQKVGTPFGAIIEHCTRAGVIRSNTRDVEIQEETPNSLQQTSHAKLTRIRELADGRIICVSRSPIAGGGWVSTHDDITDQKRTETNRASLEKRVAQMRKLEAID
jgi:PAS domain-containing protein